MAPISQNSTPRGLVLDEFPRPASAHKLKLAYSTHSSATELHYRAKAKLIAGACHDMRQPMQALVLYVEQFQRMARGDAGKRLSAQIASSVGILQEMFEQMLGMLQMETGECPPDIRSFPVSQVLERLAANFSPLAAQKGLDFHVECSPHVVRTDPVLLYRLLSNLVSNAVNFTHQGQISVRCSARMGRLSISVADSGVGIAEDDLPHIFQDFYKSSGEHLGNQSGLGLGLANVRRIAARLGFRVEVESQPGKGSIFAINLRLAEGTHASPETNAVQL